MDWLRPARGCSWDGSGREAVSRNEETSWAVEGSKAVGSKEVVDEEEEEDGS